MILSEHIKRVLSGDISPHVVEHNAYTSNVLYVAWTPTKEGPARPDYAAALSDLNEMIKEVRK
jgi:hypothetical protein